MVLPCAFRLGCSRETTCRSPCRKGFQEELRAIGRIEIECIGKSEVGGIKVFSKSNKTKVGLMLSVIPIIFVAMTMTVVKKEVEEKEVEGETKETEE